MTTEKDEHFKQWYAAQRGPLSQAPAGLAGSVRARLRPATAAWAQPRLALALGLALLLAGFGAGWLAGRGPAGQRVTFRLEAPGAREVALAGSFTGWTPQAMRRQGGEWVLEMKVPAGRQQYSFVVNGRRWLPDPDIAEAELAPDGRVHSVVDFGPTRSL